MFFFKYFKKVICFPNSLIIYILYELLLVAKKNNIKFVNLGACSTNGSEKILYSLYKFKHSCGCEPFLKYSFTKNI